MDTSEPIKRTRVRAYAPEFKAQVLAECSRLGASVAKVALAHGLNANMIHTWRREARGAVPAAAPGAGEFVPLQLAGSPVGTPVAPIRIELRQGATSVALAWPVEAADACAAWLRALLK
jgi:transposase